MRFKYGNTLITMVVLLQIQRVSGIKCYQCRDDEEKDCAGSHLKYLEECETPDSGKECYCRKLSYKFYFLRKQTEIIIRECAYHNYGRDKCYYSSEWTKGLSLVCECPTEGCNRSSHDSVISFTLLGFSLGFVLWNFPR